MQDFLPFQCSLGLSMRFYLIVYGFCFSDMSLDTGSSKIDRF